MAIKATGTHNINTVACVGAGIMGHSWATLFAIKGYPVYIQDITEEKIQQALRSIKTALVHCVEKSLIDKTAAEVAFLRVEATTDLSDAVSDADFVMESVFENYEVKQQVFQELDALTPKNTILASGSSELLMSEIQKVTKMPERCIGAHGFNPPHLIPLVELIPGDATTQHTVKRTFQFMQELGKVPIVVKKEVAAYLGNRMQNNVFQAAYDIVNSGIASVEDVDQALTAGLGIRWALYGPFLVAFFNTPSHLMERIRFRGLVKQGVENYGFLQDKSFEELVRWRDHKLIDLLRVLEHLPPREENNRPLNK